MSYMLLCFFTWKKTSANEFSNVRIQNPNDPICPTPAKALHPIKAGISLPIQLQHKALHIDLLHHLSPLDESRISDSPAYLRTLDSSMDQKQWSKANTCEGDGDIQCKHGLSHLLEHAGRKENPERKEGGIIVQLCTVKQQDRACLRE